MENDVHLINNTIVSLCNTGDAMGSPIINMILIK